MSQEIEKKGFRRLIGTKSFYLLVLSVAIPILLQNAITNLVGLIDNVMVGMIGEEGSEMSGVAIVNQLMMVYNVTLFGAVSGAGIFGAQFFGKGDIQGVRYTFRFKLFLCTALGLIAITLFWFKGKDLISLYLVEGEVGNVEETLAFGQQYLRVMLLGLVPFLIVQVYSSTLREIGKTVLPMIGGIMATVTNCVLNFILIFGHFGAPKLGVVGAAVATVISRVVELLVVVIGSHWNKRKYPFIEGLYRSLYIPGQLVKKITIMGFPLLMNEALWSAGMATLNMQYAQRGLDVVGAMNISSTLHNLFSIFMLAMGSVVAILVGQELGKGNLKRAKEMALQLLTLGAGISAIVCLGMLAISGWFPSMYSVPQQYKELATKFICVSALALPMQTVLHSSYFIIRSGGKTVITFLFDSVYAWVISIPICYVLVHFTAWSAVVIFAVVTYSELIKFTIGLILVNKGIWLQNIVKD